MTRESNMRVLENAIEAAGDEDVIFDRIASGETVINLAEEFGVSRATFYRWIEKSAERRERLREARKISASVLVDEATHILESSTKSTIPVDRERVKMRTWLAERFDRQTFSDKKDEVNVEVNVGAMYLRALKQVDMEEKERERAIKAGKVEVLPKPEPRAFPIESEKVTLDEEDTAQ